MEQVVGSYFDQLGLGKIRGRQDLIATSVAHFTQVKETGAASHRVKMESGETDHPFCQVGNTSQESEIELVELESSDEEMND